VGDLEVTVLHALYHQATPSPCQFNHNINQPLFWYRKYLLAWLTTITQNAMMWDTTSAISNSIPVHCATVPLSAVARYKQYAYTMNKLQVNKAWGWVPVHWLVTRLDHAFPLTSLFWEGRKGRYYFMSNGEVGKDGQVRSFLSITGSKQTYVCS